MAKQKQALIKDASDLKNCEEGKEVVLMFDSGQEYTGIFKGFDGDDIMLKSLDSSNMIGLPYNRLKGYLERIK